jgi:hypothetical protein
LRPDQIVRLARAKGAELEAYVEPRLGGPGTIDLDYLIADVGLLFHLLAAYIEQVEPG